ncbi:hypothetical protein EKO27_g10572 [Xylaria grammica]|uniref:Uncharacterized protein n=1 Tax=Xylaria grammica TaxID=363999 RepID=A0A439CQV0_9PEZI|nr:hypothetical protein EKO27_g10572 [Xylaria grammica]
MHTTKAFAILAFAATMAVASPVGRLGAEKRGESHVNGVPNYHNGYLDAAEKRGEAHVNDVPNYHNGYLDTAEKRGEPHVDIPNYSNGYLVDKRATKAT